MGFASKWIVMNRIDIDTVEIVPIAEGDIESARSMSLRASDDIWRFSKLRQHNAVRLDGTYENTVAMALLF
jgi:hypothetical protein